MYTLLIKFSIYKSRFKYEFLQKWLIITLNLHLHELVINNKIKIKSLTFIINVRVWCWIYYIYIFISHILYLILFYYSCIINACNDIQTQIKSTRILIIQIKIWLNHKAAFTRKQGAKYASFGWSEGILLHVCFWANPPLSTLHFWVISDVSMCLVCIVDSNQPLFKCFWIVAVSRLDKKPECI